METNYLNQVASEVSDVLSNVSYQKVETLASYFLKSKRIFIDGEGRSGFVGKCFAMRLMHLGFEVYVMGETNTPSFSAGDVYVSISGSGNTAPVLLNADKAKKKAAILLSINGNLDSKLSEMSDYSILVPATTRQQLENRQSIQLLGSLFDQSVHLLLDTVCLIISEKENISNTEAVQRHI
ncbi:SIS domain-containing protein [Vagococcus lutrae]|uniref:6-phospho-3-hexuloisomerase n=1 Tax=Vagococcus lutrae TaxID=81947 RepID=UPI00200C64EE|nr:6-phospho-3-hexuloisomerase [Vagococcus lutrae]UQF23148.1 SIS domain-containing protein [Vagococcus lutrae]UQF64768.1 SIS domain-containing protein [Vagococcus lutrae]